MTDPFAIPALLDAAADGDPDATALVAAGTPVRFGELSERTSRIAAGLAETGIGDGDVVLLWMVNRTAWLEAFFACARVGAVAFAVNTRFRATEVADILRRTRPRAVFLERRFRNIAFDELLSDAAGQADWDPPVRVFCDDDAPAGGISLSDLAESGAPRPAFAPSAETGAVMFTTSGTTSAPKFVLHPHGSIVRHAHDVARDFALTDEGTVLLQALPYCGVFGFCQATGALAARRPSILTDTFDAAGAVDLVRRHAVTHLNATDDMMQAMADAAEVGALDTLRLVGVASFNRGPDALEALSRDFGLPIVGLYGMSEVQALFARRSRSDGADRRFAGGGRPVAADASVRVRDPETQDLLPAGESGEIELRGPSLFREYFGDPDATAAAFTADGYVRTGDLGARDGDGGFTFSARMGDTLRLGGFLVNPAEIGDYIASLDGVADCQVVAATVDGRTRPVAFVVPAGRQPPDEAVLLAACRATLAPFKVPVRIHALDEFPTVASPNGTKIQRHVLRRAAQELVEK